VFCFSKQFPSPPPTVKRNKNPSTQKVKGFQNMGAPKRLAAHLKILIPVGTAIIIVALEK